MKYRLAAVSVRLGLGLLAVLFLIGAAHRPTVWITCLIEGVPDGDSARCRDGRELRYAGIDTPERDQPFHDRARRRNRELVQHRTIRARVWERDRFGRLIVEVFRQQDPETPVNIVLLREGLAWVYYHRAVDPLFARYLAVQRQAMRERRGLWKTVAGLRGPVIGNRNRRRFHAPTCASVRRIHPANRRRFARPWDAFWAGLAPARDCSPLGRAPGAPAGGSGFLRPGGRGIIRVCNPEPETSS